MSTYNPYRCFIMKDNNLFTYMHDEVKLTSQQLLLNFINYIEENKKYPIEFTKDEGGLIKEKYMIYFHKMIDESTFILKLANGKTIKFHDLQESDIIEEEASDFPYIYVIVDLNWQLFLFQYNSKVFSKTSVAKNALSALMNDFFLDYGYTVEFDTVNESSEFWKIKDQLEDIREVKFCFNSPNLFGGIFETNELIKKLSDTFNNSKTVLALKNKNGKLKNINKDNLQDPLEYTSNGGGSWKIEGRKKAGQKFKAYTSEGSIKKIYVDSLENIKKIKSEIDDLNNELSVKQRRNESDDKEK